MKSPLIIDRPDLQAWHQKVLFGTLTAAFWVGWMFLWLPLLTLLGWAFFGYRFHLHMITLDGYKGFLELLAVYALVIIGMGGALVLWATYNHLRFRGVDRRRLTEAPSTAVIAAQIKHPQEAIQAWRDYAILTVHHDAQGGILRVEPALALVRTPVDQPTAEAPQLRVA